jgi:hypothetical protein
VARSGDSLTFRHSVGDDPPADLQRFYEWSPNLLDWYRGDGLDGPIDGPAVSFLTRTASGEVEVTAIPSAPLGRIFVRAAVGLE